MLFSDGDRMLFALASDTSNMCFSLCGILSLEIVFQQLVDNALYGISKAFVSLSIG